MSLVVNYGFIFHYTGKTKGWSIIAKHKGRKNKEIWLTKRRKSSGKRAKACDSKHLKKTGSMKYSTRKN